MGSEFADAIQRAYRVALRIWPEANPFQPGFIRESIMADSLNHNLIVGKKGSDARDEDGKQVEYKTWKAPYRSKLNIQSTTGLDHHLKGTEAWYFGKFKPPFELIGLWSVQIDKVKKFCEDFLKRTKVKQGHITIDFHEKWVIKTGQTLPISKEPANRFVQSLRTAQEIAKRSHGVDDITLKGRIREILIAEILGHKIIVDSMLSDARDSKGDYEYLTSLEGNFQMTHMTEENSHNKVFRNEAIYCAQFEDPVTISEIWKIDPKVYMKKMKKRRPWPKDTQNNFTITLDWVKKVGTKVYPSA